jgi:hypothetical protein
VAFFNWRNVSCSSSEILEPKMTVQSNDLKSSEKKLRSVGSGGICMLTMGRRHPHYLPQANENE